MRKISIILIILILCMAIIGGCTVPSVSPSEQAVPASQPAAVPSAAPASSGPVEEVRIIASAFDPAILNVQAGTTVMWTNEDRISHRVVHLPELPSDRELFH